MGSWDPSRRGSSLSLGVSLSSAPSLLAAGVLTKLTLSSVKEKKKENKKPKPTNSRKLQVRTSKPWQNHRRLPKEEEHSFIKESRKLGGLLQTKSKLLVGLVASHWVKTVSHRLSCCYGRRKPFSLWDSEVLAKAGWICKVCLWRNQLIRSGGQHSPTSHWIPF